MREAPEGVVYRCTFSSQRGRLTAHVRAPDVGRALDAFEATLRDEGVEVGGELVVEPVIGPGARRARFVPS